MTTEFKNPKQTTHIDGFLPAPLVSPEGEALRQKTGPADPFRQTYSTNPSTNEENKNG